jgi:hypothetical protein
MPLSKITNPFLDPAGSASSNVYSPSANTIGIVTSGLDRVRVDSGGNLGVGINTVATSGSRRIIQVANGASGGMLILGNSASENGSPRLFLESTNDLGLASGVSAGIMKFYTNDTVRMTIDASGRVTRPFQPGFKATATGDRAAQTVGGSDALLSNLFTVVTTNGNFNTGGHYNTANGRFTAPVAGKYYIFANIRWEPLVFTQNNYIRLFAAINGLTTGYYSGLHQIAGTNEAWDSYLPMSISGILDLAASDYVELRGGLNGGTATMYPSESSFGGYLLG